MAPALLGPSLPAAAACAALPVTLRAQPRGVAVGAEDREPAQVGAAVEELGRSRGASLAGCGATLAFVGLCCRRWPLHPTRRRARSCRWATHIGAPQAKEKKDKDDRGIWKTHAKHKKPGNPGAGAAAYTHREVAEQYRAAGRTEDWRNVRPGAGGAPAAREAEAEVPPQAPHVPRAPRAEGRRRDSDETERPSYPGEAVVFWDLDNKMPAEGVSLGACMVALQSRLAYGGAKVGDVNVYANSRTLEFAYGRTDQGMPFGPVGSGRMPNLPEPPKNCPSCNKPLEGNDAYNRRRSLQQHFERHRKDFMAAKVKAESFPSERASFMLKEQRYMASRQEILMTIGRMQGMSMEESSAEASKKIGQVDGVSFQQVVAWNQEVDKAIIDDALSFLKAKQSNPGTICLISDDADFHEMLGKFKTQGWHVFAITAGSIMHDFADSAMWWDVFMSNAASFEKTGAAGDETSRVYFRIPNKQ